MEAAIIITDRSGVITSVGGGATRLTGQNEEFLIGLSVFDVIGLEPDDLGSDPVDGLCQSEWETELTTPSPPVPVFLTVSPLRLDEGDSAGLVCSATDITQRRSLEVELRHAQRLESIGQLAAGVAHEINTPVQFVGDSVSFLGDVLQDLLGLVDDHRPLRAAVSGDERFDELARELQEKEDEIDVEFVRLETPQAVTRTLDGIGRVAAIISALKQFSHPGGDTMAPATINEIIENTLTVSRSEYRCVAEVHTELAAVNEVFADSGDLGQVFINLVVNAAHAIADVTVETDSLGSITVTSHDHEGGVLVRVADTGGGIPLHVQPFIFDPFYTTKEPGRGTGQGLSIARNVVVNRHNGRLSFTVQENIGTTFDMWLPLRGFE
ncbi:MAG: two-component system NtrC family sensor kinase [Acidimicrobiales bacterium]|jgi:two-component system NtrC family sensor kinase